MALGAAEQLPAPAAAHPDVSGMVVDLAASGGFATFVALTDGTTSMYTSTGGGVIGAGGRPGVAAATQQLLTVVQEHVAAFSLDGTDELPAKGTVRLHLLRADGGRRTADLPEDAFWGRVGHPLTPVIAAVQHVITSLRESTPP